MSNANNHVVLVDEDDNAIGTMEKMQAHQENRLHRAFSIMLLNADNPNLCLLQQRQSQKYHCPNLWSNTCCSHPFPGESILQAGARRLQEELGLSTELKSIDTFVYQADFDNGLHEHEYDHVLLGTLPEATSIIPNPDEVKAVQWISLQDALALSQGDTATPWLQPVVESVLLLS